MYRGSFQDRVIDNSFNQKFQDMTNDYIKNGPKYGNYREVPVMIANEEERLTGEDYRPTFYGHLSVG